MFAEDTELYSSTPHSTTDSLFCNMHNCVSDVKKWTIHNKLQLSEREALLFNPSTSSHLPDVHFFFFFFFSFFQMSKPNFPLSS